jgi:hypothetical protein
MKKMHYKPELIWPILRENQACVARLAWFLFFFRGEHSFEFSSVFLP